jgi:nitrate reductase gamma subunit
MRRLSHVLVALWFVLALAVGVAWAQASVVRDGEVHLTIEAVGVIVGIVAFVGPGFYLVGRFNQRLTTVERQLETLVSKGVEVGERIARAVERQHRGEGRN